MSLRVDISIYNDKNMLAANHMPIAALPVPIAVLVRMPVGVIPIGIGMYSGRSVCVDSGAIGSARMISTIGATNGRAAFSVYRRAITGYGLLYHFSLDKYQRKEWWPRRRGRLIHIS
jgi:hypothetical protein